MSSITLLGTGTCQIEHERRASSVLLELDGLLVLFDCGHGIVQRLLEAGISHDKINHIVLSHFHPDHVSDLIPLMQAGAWSQHDARSSDLHVYGPRGLQRVINGLMDIFGSSSFTRPSYAIYTHEITSNHVEIATGHFDFISLPPAGNHGLRWQWGGKRYALTGDSHFHAQEIAFLTGVDLAVIDAGHLEDEQIVQLGAQSQARVIVCSHLYRQLDAPRLQGWAASRGYTGTILVGRDLMSFEI